MRPMFLQSVSVLDVDFCVQQPNKFAARTRASVDLREITPYLNRMFRTSVYNHDTGSLKFTNDKIEYTIVENQINIAKFANRTELHELLDWLKDLINDTYDSMSEIAPLFECRKRVPVLFIYNLLPKTNCGMCGEKSCMVFAAQVNKLEVDIEACPPLLEPAFTANKRRLESAFA
jgi:ArsR family metal-binding transcriptional regulator